MKPFSCVLACFFLFAASAFAQTRQTVTVTVAAPVFVTPNANQTPLRVASVGSVLLLLGQEGDWSNVEFQDPQYGRRVGYIQTRNVRIDATPAQATPVDLTVGPETSEQRAPVRVAAPRPQTRQRGDVAIGYVFMHEEGLSLPLGISGSDAWRVHPNVDVAIESQFAHGTVDILVADLGVNYWSLLAGPRFWGGSRYGDKTRAFGQVLAGVMSGRFSVSPVDYVRLTGFALQPGVGVEVPVAKAVAIRPQVDLLIGWLDEELPTSRDARFNVNIVFRLFSN